MCLWGFVARLGVLGLTAAQSDPLQFRFHIGGKLGDEANGSLLKLRRRNFVRPSRPRS